MKSSVTAFPNAVCIFPPAPAAEVNPSDIQPPPLPNCNFILLLPSNNSPASPASGSRRGRAASAALRFPQLGGCVLDFGGVAALLWFSTRSALNVYLPLNVGGCSQILEEEKPKHLHLLLLFLSSVVAGAGDLCLQRAEQLVTECTYEQE